MCEGNPHQLTSLLEDLHSGWICDFNIMLDHGEYNELFQNDTLRHFKQFITNLTASQIPYEKYSLAHTEPSKAFDAPTLPSIKE